MYHRVARCGLAIQPTKKRPGKGGTGAQKSDSIYGENDRHWSTIYRENLPPYIVPWYNRVAFSDNTMKIYDWPEQDTG